MSVLFHKSQWIGWLFGGWWVVNVDFRSKTNPRDVLGIVLECGHFLRAIIGVSVNRMANGCTKKDQPARVENKFVVNDSQLNIKQNKKWCERKTKISTENWFAKI